uniref:Uncharacterized protein n=1 Tax=Candidatus Kentrum eta TaxID=2126337 RepID=A0A450U8U2_9GAMM|nr:MAG: hypothetical protein BECKH772A_GA0070896_100084 [Candidatus Kentron sp. H]VFJ93577.1 MAG: hypothetical protein BECKH772B_GA0070898_1004624 [Candidatus Kentron sp. H]VFJ96832.1 MAG: hypothetical protein BECKH772A_GA0070896_101118 [Candidatus Kentron sp. H]VFJ97447.1 MAG: hypothetical protein BECKH772B_GA0070898_101127 [Candidatus Kentron sp. H]
MIELGGIAICCPMNAEILTMVEVNKKTEALPVRQNTKDIEMGEEQLSVLIKEAGEEARGKKREVMARHYDRLREAVNRAAAS